MQWVSHPSHPLLSAPITYTDAMANSWLVVRDEGLLFYIHVRIEVYWEHSFNRTTTWEMLPWAAVMTIIKWGENYSETHTQTHTRIRGKLTHSPRKHLRKTGMVTLDTTWWVPCISIAFCSYGPWPMSNIHLRINSHYCVTSRKPGFHHSSRMSSWHCPCFRTT